MKVLVDGVAAGLVRSVVDEGGRRFAVIDIDKAAPGAVVPRVAGVDAVLRKFSDSQTLMVAAGAVILLALVAVQLRLFFRFFFVISVLAPALLLAWLSYPFATPYVGRFYAAAPAVEIPASPPNTSSVKGRAELAVRDILVKRPDPVLVAVASLTFAYFLFLSVLLGTALRSARRS